MGYASTKPQTQLEWGSNITGYTTVLTTVAADQGIGDFVGVAPPILTGIKYAYLDVIISNIKNTSAAGSNALDGNQYISIRKVATDYHAILLAGTGFTTAASATMQGPIRLYGNIDIKAYLTSTGNSIIWEDSKSTRDNLEVTIWQCVLRMVYE